MAVLLPTLIVLLSSFLYYRSNLLGTLYYNAPARLEQINNFGGFDIEFQDIIRNCEDIYLDEDEGFALLSCDPGRDEWNTVMGIFRNPQSHPDVGIYLYNYTTPNSLPEKLSFTPAKTTPFHPLGIEYHAETHTLFLINHAPPIPTIETHHLDLTHKTAHLLHEFHHPSHLATPNSITALSATELLITNDHYFPSASSPFFSKLESYTGFPGGSVAWVSFPNSSNSSNNNNNNNNNTKEIQIKPLLHLPFPNGITLLNSTTLAIVSTTTSSIRLYHISRTETSIPSLKFLKSFTVPFIPDNISVDGKGRVLIAGHPHAPSLEVVARRNGECIVGGKEEEVCEGKRLSYVVEWREGEEGVRTLYAGKGFGSSSSAVRDGKRGVGFVTGLYEKGVLVWRD